MHPIYLEDYQVPTLVFLTTHFKSGPYPSQKNLHHESLEGNAFKTLESLPKAEKEIPTSIHAHARGKKLPFSTCKNFVSLRSFNSPTFFPSVFTKNLFSPPPALPLLNSSHDHFKSVETFPVSN